MNGIFFREHRRASQVVVIAWIAVVILSVGAVGQVASGGSQNHQLKPKPTPQLVADPFPQPDVAPAPPPPRTPEQLPPRAPQVVWDGKLLSINSENSTLAAILAAVRLHLHAVIDVPPGSGAERVAAQLGPAPAREVLTSLLSGSNFNYVIQASDTDENAVQSVMLSTRSKTDDTFVGNALASASGVRRAPGYFDSGRNIAAEPAREVESENTVSEPTAALDGGAPIQDQTPARTEPVSASVQPAVDTNSQVVVPDVAPAEGATGLGIDRPAAAAATASPGSSAEASPSSSSTSQAIQDMQNMFEQRRKIQAQRNAGISQTPN